MAPELLRTLSRLTGVRRISDPDSTPSTVAPQPPSADAEQVAAEFLAEIVRDPAFKLAQPKHLAQPLGE
jgi:hypothetical protein